LRRHLLDIERAVGIANDDFMERIARLMELVDPDLAK